MKNVPEKEIEKYLKEIKGALLCRNKDTKRMLDELKSSFYDYKDSHPDATVSDIKNHFGEAETIAEGFNAELNERDIKKYRIERVLKIAIISILAAFLLFMVGLTVYVAIDSSEGMQFEIEIADHGEVEEGFVFED